jgi:thiol-disulfide isomerase/thioredoxin
MKLLLFLLISAFFSRNGLGQEQREVLVEIFTNSHCPSCPAAHNVMEQYLNANPNANNINYIYYHMVYPYPDDQLYIQSSFDSDARHAFYNPIAATPRGFFDGIIQGSTSGWENTLDNLTRTESPLKVELSGTKSISQFDINAAVTRTGAVSENDLVINFVVVEDVFYDGRNTVSNHKHVMRKMLPSANGQAFSINLSETKNIQQIVTLNENWNPDSLSVIVFVQSTSTKTVYQSETISYNDLSITSVNNETATPTEFTLLQNYPNPFNPQTNIKFQIKEPGFTTLKVYNVLGNEIASLINDNLSAGSFEINFNASQLSSGVYFYTLTSGNNKQTNKMILLR